MALTRSMRFSRDRLMKLVSTKTRYGGTSASLCERKSEVGSGALHGRTCQLHFERLLKVGTHTW